ncbi:MAG: hypothetical protein ACJA08_001401 [Cyclobacteriaceae bacterium]|jgi:hypothetical protein
MKMNQLGTRIFIGVGVVIMLLGAAFMYLSNRNRTLSPPGNASLTNGSLDISISYSRPSVRGRLIFGPESEGALQPWGSYWRLGANESTEITFNQNVKFNGKDLPSGTYKMYAIPGEAEFQVFINTSLGDWGAFESDSNLDLFSTPVPVVNNSHVEQHTIRLEKSDGGGITIIVEFADVRLEIPLEPA